MKGDALIVFVRLALLLCVVCVLQLEFAAAQENVPPPPTTELHDLLKNEIAATKEIKDKSDHALVEETQRMRDAREEYYVFSFKNSQEAFQWQAVSTKLIFVIVLLVVGAGLILSWRQFDFVHKAPLTQTKQTKKEQADKGTGETEQESKGNITSVSEVNTIEVSTSGVKITSSVVGLVILVISIVFFFLYLHDVYPLQELSMGSGKPASITKEENKKEENKQ